ncbi:cob(I)yrinic acid a,c-diamide adenosyltransferase [Planctomicrobium piriforme]|uniref:Corrinoid adenosyltransferase n=1 Tax=Planctomicrobium piriforme TaxID=1576369 RepID=A0A1I3G147_9PLAN|nr:cob(I)yrinic acid a,c-diamide adenosyltransferase [Planctomicrobium piriforme]SFI17166.1 cob(I)alamin adenosyltransferase [Planctomicrobium piriforme]
MVYLNRIYTKSGDTGETALGNGERVPKTHPRIGAYGSVDELNSTLGAALALGQLTAEQQARLTRIQNDLFDVGADLCVPETDIPPEFPPLRVTSEQVTQLEHWIDADTSQLQPLTSFILPGGTPAAALLHMARAICRRSEIEVLKLAAEEKLNPQATIYLNRLSDLLFVMARMANDAGKGDVLWTPGGMRE